MSATTFADDIVECCGAHHATPFCPYCGKKLKTNPLGELLDYVIKTANRQMAIAAQEASELTKHPDAAPNIVQRQKRVIAAAQRWQLWKETLAELVRGRK